MTEHTPHRIYGHIMMFSTILIYSFNTNFMKTLTPEYMGPLGFAFLRCLSCLLCFFIASLFLPKETRKLSTKKDYWMLLLGGAVGMGGYLMCYMYGLSKTGPVDVFVIRSSQPLIVLVISIFFLHKKAYWNKIVGVVLGIGGTVCISLYHPAHGDINSFWGDSLIFIATLFYGAYLVFLKPYTLRINPFVVMMWLSVASTLITLPFGIKEFIEAPLWHRPFNWEVVGKLSFTLIFSTMISNILTVSALRFISSFSTSVYTYILPITGTLVSIWFGLQTFTWHYAIAFGLIVSGFIIVNINNKNKETQPHEPIGMH